MGVHRHIRKRVGNKGKKRRYDDRVKLEHMSSEKIRERGHNEGEVILFFFLSTIYHAKG